MHNCIYIFHALSRPSAVSNTNVMAKHKQRNLTNVCFHSVLRKGLLLFPHLLYSKAKQEGKR